MRAVAASLTGLYAAYQLGLGGYFALFRPALLLEDLRFMGVPAVVPGLAAWLDLVFLVMGGQMAAVGALAAALSWRARRGTSGGDVAALAAAGALSVALMSLVNFRLASDFRWWLLAPVGLWAAALAAALAGRGTGGAGAGLRE